MGKLFGGLLMILGVVAFFYGTVLIPQNPTISDSAMQIIAIIAFVIGVVMFFLSTANKPPRNY